MPKTCLIIGLGQIGMGYDYDLVDDSKIYTHARAISMHPGFSLEGAVDPLAENRTRFQSRFGKQAFSHIQDALLKIQPEIVVIASSSESHMDVLSQVLSVYSPKLILSEKPLSYHINVARAMVEMCEEKGVDMFVNYIRRSDPGVIEIKRRLDSGEIKCPVKVNAWYSKGIINNGSHFINLLEFWLGRILSTRVINVGRLWEENDPEPEVEIKFERGSAIIRPAWEESYSYYSVEMLSKSGRLCYDQGGELIEWQGVRKDDNFNGYQILCDQKEIVENGMSVYQWNVYEELQKYFRGLNSSLCTAREALRALEIINAFVNEKNL